MAAPLDAHHWLGHRLPADTLLSAVDNARRGVVTHITVKGERVAAIVSESTLAMAQLRLPPGDLIQQVRFGSTASTRCP